MLEDVFPAISIFVLMVSIFEVIGPVVSKFDWVVGIFSKLEVLASSLSEVAFSSI